VRRVLREAGSSKIALDPYDFSLDMGVGRGLDAAVVTALESGPTSRALLDRPSRSQPRFDQPARGQTVQLGAAIWIVTAVDSETETSKRDICSMEQGAQQL
jgi:hypothetical protein